MSACRRPALRFVSSALFLASVLVACAHEVQRVPFDPSRAGKKPDSWKCFEAKLPLEQSPRSYCYADGSECEDARAKFSSSNPNASSVGLCGLETKAFCFDWYSSPETPTRDCAKTSEECELQSKSKADHAPLWIKGVTSCAAM